VTTILLFASVLLHELGHAVMAKVYHIPVQRITLFIFGGVAQLGSESRTAMSEFLIAIIGPIVSAALAGLFFVAGQVAQAATPTGALLQYLAGINIYLLAGFNLIPGFPLDGGRVFRAIVWGITKDMSRATRVAVQIGRLVAFGFITLGVWLMLGGRLPASVWRSRRRCPAAWLAFIGWFLKQAADSSSGTR
jgi:Zn-dependent protease